MLGARQGEGKDTAGLRLSNGQMLRAGTTLITRVLQPFRARAGL